MYTSWFDLKKMEESIGKNLKMDDLEKSKEKVWQTLDEECGLIQSSKVVIGGFSQGAVLSLKAGLEYKKPLGGILSFSGFYTPWYVN